MSTKTLKHLIRARAIYEGHECSNWYSPVHALVDVPNPDNDIRYESNFVLAQAIFGGWVYDPVYRIVGWHHTKKKEDCLAAFDKAINIAETNAVLQRAEELMPRFYPAQYKLGIERRLQQLRS